jgi:uncharacterized membrane protein YccF (DUF307 family)
MAPYIVQYIWWRTQTPPLRTVSEILWILISGWLLFLSYILTIVPLFCSIIGIVFIPKVVHIAIFAFDPIGLQIVKNVAAPGNPLRWYRNPKNFVVRIMNVCWFIFLGWEFFLLQFILAMVQFLTIFGIGNAINQLKIGKETLMPFGKRIQPRPMPVKPVRHVAPPQQDQQHQPPAPIVSSPAFPSVDHV